MVPKRLMSTPSGCLACGLSKLAPLGNLFSSGSVMTKTWLNLKPKVLKTVSEVKPKR